MTAIDALRKAAKGKALNEAKAESDIRNCVEAYHSGYVSTDITNGQRFLRDEIRKRMASRKTISQGKDHIEKMRRHIAKLREDVEVLLHQDHQDTLFFAGNTYEKNKWFADDDKYGWPLLHSVVRADFWRLL